MSFSFGRVSGGSDVHESKVALLLDQMEKAIYQAQDQLLNVSEGSLNIVYGIPGFKWKPDFTGSRTGKFSRKLRKLMVQIAVPKKEVHSDHPERFIFDSLREAVELGRLTFRAAKIPFSADEHLSLIGQIEKQWTTKPDQ